MPIASDIILDRIAEDGYSLSEAGWIRAQDHEFYFKVTAEKDGHRHIQHHVAQLSLRLRIDADLEMPWVGSGWGAP